MKTEILVVGSGIAGLSFALKAAKHVPVAIVTKRRAFDSNSADAQGGIAVPTSKADEKKHIADTLEAGRGICNAEAVGLVVRTASARLNELLEYGVKFERDGRALSRALEAGHSKARIVFNSDATGKAIEHKLVTLAKENPNITILENMALQELVVRDNQCIGGKFLAGDESPEIIPAGFTVLATGGMGQLFEKTTNPEIATGDGYAIASRAGAVLENLEFVQFHPTKLDFPSTHPFLISEVLRGEGGTLVNARGKEFMKNYDAKAELAPRDVVSRAIFLESEKGQVYLDMTHKGAKFLKKRFPTIYAKCFGYDIDLAEDLVPVSAAAHYMCGGVKTDLRGRTSVENLYAIGEVACTGVHGANRLASNSLLEAMVFAKESAEDIISRLQKGHLEIIPPEEFPIIDFEGNLKGMREKLQKIMWEKVGLVRKGAGLREALIEIAKIRLQLAKYSEKGTSGGISELSNMALLSQLIADSASKRKKSLGCHYILR
ncbi:MAG: L-aspartate oxidase [Candidatus Micrarchaeota archaeon]